MKKVKKIIIILIIALIAISNNYCYAIISDIELVDGLQIAEGESDTTSITDGFDQADRFISDGANGVSGIDLADDMKVIFNTLYIIGLVLSVIIGGIIGIKYMLSSVEEKAQIKETMIPYILGCAVIFGAFTIWKIVVGLMQKIA